MNRSLGEMADRRANKQYSDALFLLPTVPLFSKLHPPELPTLAAAFTTRKFGKGETVLEQGQPGDEMFFIQSGTAAVFVQPEGEEDGGPAPERERVAVLGPGDYFGEAALLNDTPRNATVEAAELLELKVLSRSDFHRLKLSREKLHFQKRRAVC